jgi:hypothetical protein
MLVQPQQWTGGVVAIAGAAYGTITGDDTVAFVVFFGVGSLALCRFAWLHVRVENLQRMQRPQPDTQVRPALPPTPTSATDPTVVVALIWVSRRGVSCPDRTSRVNSGQRSRAVAAIGSLAARDLLCTRGGTRRPRTAEAIAHSEGSPGTRYVASTDGVATRKARPALTPGHSEDFVVSHPVQLQETNPPATGPGVLVHDYGQDRLEVRLALGPKATRSLPLRANTSTVDPFGQPWLLPSR